MKKGQTLIMLLVFMTIATIIISAAVMVTLVNSVSSSKLESGSLALDVAETGAENALLHLLRDPNYSGTGYNNEPPLTVGNGTATVSVMSGIVTATGKTGNFTRIIQVTTNYNNNVLTISSWQERF